MKILIVEDERLLADALKVLLDGRGFEADTVYDGKTGEEYARSGIYDLLILDVMLPGIDGYELAKRLRAAHLGMPILMLTAKSELEDRITGLDCGADYYLTKPFDTRELLACVGALLRRQGGQVDELVFGNTALDLATAMLTCGGKSIRLSAKEFEIMRLLLQDRGRNYPKEMILEKVWGYDSEGNSSTVVERIKKIRAKFSAAADKEYISTVWGIGYKWNKT